MTLEVSPGAAPSRLDWRAWLAPGAVAGVVLVTALLYWPSTQSLLHEWLETDASAYSHGPLVVAVALWLAMRALRGQPAGDAALRLWPLLLLAGVSVAWLVLLRAGIQVAHQALLPIIVWLLLWAVLGLRAAGRVAVPVGLLYSAIPVWHVAVPALQATTVAAVSVMLRIAGVTAYVVDDFVYIRSGAFHIEEGCAGLHYFIVAATIAVMYGELRGERWRMRVRLLALAVALALIGNWLRVFTLIVVGDLTNMQNYLVRVEHGNFGWLVFALTMIGFLLIARAWTARDADREVRPLPVMHDRASGSAGPMRAALLAFALSAIGPAWLVMAPVRPAAAANLSIPAAVAGWNGPRETCNTRWRPRFVDADQQSQREYTRDGQAVCAYLATYLWQHQDKELIGYFNLPYARNAEIVSRTVREAAGRAVNEVQIGDEVHADRIVWYSYLVGSRGMRRGIEAQFAYAVGSLTGAPASSVYAISAACQPDCAAARRLLEEFLPNIKFGDVVEN